MQVAYRAVRSNRQFAKMPEVLQYVAGQMSAEVKPHLVKQFEMRVRNWEHKPHFVAELKTTQEETSIRITAKGEYQEYWLWNELGTPPHKIPKGGPKLLKMTLGYLPKTRPGGVYGFPGYYAGPTIYRVTQVDHPGTEPRGHTKRIAQEQKEWYSRTMANIWRRAIQRA